MKRTTLRACAVLLLAALSIAGCRSGSESGTVMLRPDDAGLAELSFITGQWSTAGAGAPNRVEEHWTNASAGTMFGISRTIRDGKTAFFEYMRIERTPLGPMYIANPRGRGETMFRLVESGDGRVVFENPDHDYPTRIIYERTREGLHGRIEGQQRGQPRSEDWHYRPAQVVASPK